MEINIMRVNPEEDGLFIMVKLKHQKIPNEWYSWMHHMNKKIENDHNLKKYEWQKEHLPNQTGSKIIPS